LDSEAQENFPNGVGATELLLHPGDFCWDHSLGANHSYIHMILPDGTRNILPVCRTGPNNHAAWGWDGNEDEPTLTPSIHCHDHWHGFLTKGQFISC
jgi:hypothetical protein